MAKVTDTSPQDGRDAEKPSVERENHNKNLKGINKIIILSTNEL
jgi:hypothetical protein